MKVAITTLFFWPVQPDTTPANNLAKALTEANHQVTVLTQDQEANGDLIKRPKTEIHNNIKIIRSKTYAKVATFGKIWSPKITTNYDLIHCLGGYRHPFSFLAYKKRKNAKFILSPFFPTHPKSFPFNLLANLIDKTIGKYLIKHTDLCLAETTQEKSWLEKMGAKRIEIIPNPIPKEMFKKITPTFKSKHKINNPLIFTLGNHTPIKNFEEIIKTIKDLDITLVIGGQHTEYTNKLKTLANQLGIAHKIIFPGFLNLKQKREIYADADLFILSSKRESLGIVLVEAMAQGTPVIASNTGGIPDVVPDSYCLYSPGNTEQLNQKIQELLNNKTLANRISKKGKEKAKKYLFENVARRYNKLIEEL